MCMCMCDQISTCVALFGIHDVYINVCVCVYLTGCGMLCVFVGCAYSSQGDIVLLGLRDFQDSKADVIMKYTPDEAKQLQRMGELPDSGSWSPAILVS